MSRTRIQLITAMLLLFLCGTAASASFTTPITFVANTPLLASQLNSNFAAIAAALTSSGNGNLRIGNSSGTYTDALPTSSAGSLTITGGNGTLNLDTAPSQLQHITVPISSADILACYATPVQLIPAPAAGKNIIVNQAMLTMTTTSTQYTGGTNVVFQIGNSPHGAGQATTTAISSTVVDAAAGTSYTMVPEVSYTGTAATGVYLSVTGSAFITGTGTAVADIYYSVQ